MAIFDIEGPMAVAQQTSNGSFPGLVENNPYKKAFQSSQETVKPPAPHTCMSMRELSDSDLQGCFFEICQKFEYSSELESDQIADFCVDGRQKRP
jgi:hypothetical protein